MPQPAMMRRQNIGPSWTPEWARNSPPLLLVQEELPVGHTQRHQAAASLNPPSPAWDLHHVRVLHEDTLEPGMPPQVLPCKIQLEQVDGE